MWNPEDYGGLTAMVIDPTRMWVPKLAIGNRYVYTMTITAFQIEMTYFIGIVVYFVILSSRV